MLEISGTCKLARVDLTTKFTLLLPKVFVALWLEMILLDVKLHNLTDQNALSSPYRVPDTSKYFVNANPTLSVNSIHFVNDSD